MTDLVKKTRIFVGGLFPEVTEEDLKSRFNRFGTISSVHIKVRKNDNGAPFKTFAYMDIAVTQKDLSDCFSLFNKTKWKGSVLKLQMAKEDFLKRLEEERKEAHCPPAPVEITSPRVDSALEGVAGVDSFVMKGAPPGTVPPGQKNWIVGKYGRVLPILNLRKTDRKRSLRVDPSKFVHNVKKLKEEDGWRRAEGTAGLTWSLQEVESEVSRRQQGIFPAWKPKARKRPPKPDEEEPPLRKLESEIEMQVVPQLDVTESQKLGKMYDSDSEDSDDVYTQRKYIRTGAIVAAKLQSLRQESTEDTVLDSDSNRDAAIAGSDSSESESESEGSVSDSELHNLPHQDSRLSDHGETDSGRNEAVVEQLQKSASENIVLQSRNPVRILTEFKGTRQLIKEAANVKPMSNTQTDNLQITGKPGTSGKSVVKERDGKVELSASKKKKEIKQKPNTELPASPPSSNQTLRKLKEFGGTTMLQESNAVKPRKTSQLCDSRGKKQSSAEKRSSTSTVSKEKKVVDQSVNQGQLGQLSRNSEADFDNMSVSSADTDEILSTSNKSSKVPLWTNTKPKLLQKPIHQWNSGLVNSGFIDEYASGLTQVERNVGMPRQYHDSEDDDSDFEALVKRKMATIDKCQLPPLEKTDIGDMEVVSVKEIKQPKPAVSQGNDTVRHDDRPAAAVAKSKPKKSPVKKSEKHLSINSRLEHRLRGICDSEDSGKVAPSVKPARKQQSHVPSNRLPEGRHRAVPEIPRSSTQNIQDRLKALSDKEHVSIVKPDKLTTRKSNKSLETENSLVVDPLVTAKSGNRTAITSQKKRNKKTVSQSQSDDKEAESSDNQSVSSADTEELLSTGKSPLFTQARPGTVQGSARQTCQLEEFSSGMEKQQNTEPSGSHSKPRVLSSEDEDSDFEQYVKKQLTKVSQVKNTALNQCEASNIDKTSESKAVAKKRPTLSANVTVNNVAASSLSDNKSKSADTPDSTTQLTPNHSNPAGTVISTGRPSGNKPGGDGSGTDADQKRLATVWMRKKENLAQKSAIQKALARVDSQAGGNKKIVFDEDSDDSGHEEDNRHVSSRKTGSSLSVTQRGDTDMMLDQVKSNDEVHKKKDKKNLLDSDEEDSDDEDRFKLRPQFVGKAGEKLLNLQGRYNNDERFKLDPRFKDSDSEHEEESQVKEAEEVDERSRSLKILQSVVGRKVSTVPKKVFKDMSALRFDPSNEAHSQFEIRPEVQESKQESKSKKKKKSQEKEEEENAAVADPLPEVSAEKFYEVSTSLKETFSEHKEKESAPSQTFSLLAAFGKVDDEVEQDSKEPSYKVEAVTMARKGFTVAERFRTESSSDSESEDSEPRSKPAEIIEKPAKPAAPVRAVPSSFFFIENDERLKEGETFVRTEDMETVRERWNETRHQFIDDYKNRHKNLRRKLKKDHQSKRGGKRRRT